MRLNCRLLLSLLGVDPTIPHGNFSVLNISLLDYLPDGPAGHGGDAHWWWVVSVGMPVWVRVGMPGMLGMPSTKLGMLVPAGFSIFGGGRLRNVPTPPADQLGSLGGRGLCRAAPKPALSVTVRVPSVPLLLSSTCCPRVFGGRGMLGGGRQIPPQPNP